MSTTISKETILFEALANQKFALETAIKEKEEKYKWQLEANERYRDRLHEIRLKLLPNSEFTKFEQINQRIDELLEFEKNHSVNELNLRYFTGFAEGIEAAKKEIVKKVPKYITGRWIPQRKYYLRILSNLINETFKKANDARR